MQVGREIWTGDKLTLAQIIVRMGKVFGDICRWERDAAKNKDAYTADELKDERAGAYGGRAGGKGLKIRAKCVCCNML